MVLIALAVIVIVVVALCAAGTIPANVGIGIRIPATRQSQRAWEAGHRAAYLPAVIGGSAVIITSVGGLLLPDAAAVISAIGAVLLVATLAWAVVGAHRAASAIEAGK